MELELSRIQPKEKDILGNLLEYYAYEFSPLLDSIELNEESRFGFSDLDAYFRDDAFSPYFIRVGGKLAGFVIVNRVDENPAYQIEQFFVMNRYTRQGIGERAARQAFDRHPGKWMVTQIRNNTRAQAFWRRVIHRYTDGRMTETTDEEGRSIQWFDNGNGI